MEALQQAYRILYSVILVALALGVIIALFRTITGRLTVDRIIGINIISTMAVLAICVLALLFAESYVVDVAIVYVILSFIAVLILCKIYINLHGRKKEDKHGIRMD